ncbi:hypothetical protein VFPFJ_11606 [Purpureocillium lilacinum]|uniref:NmrA-like domain-containing protein n=1 Tax=Purpureocillium lilacinum TaxID=33203 RepID=A0A179F1X5_PURLI|nr:hypothetical protein VFPFJ_11606 [Purpureocillium lilacinum]OAQ59089.1 hypothetical protein VFPFJ_11606 [Purpureocillium lilacinum]
MSITLEEMGCDTICLVPPAHHDKFDICVELVEAAKRAAIPNVLLISSAGCDYADTTKATPAPLQEVPPALFGFYAENLLLYAPQVKEEGVLPLPIGENHKFALVALGVAAYVLIGKGKHGFDDRHRGQMMVVTGPMLCAGNEPATAASKALGADMKFENISQAEAKRVLKAQSESDRSELQYLLDYYSLVREGKTNYIATTAFHDVTGKHPTEPDDFFRMYEDEVRPRKRAKQNHK